MAKVRIQKKKTKQNRKYYASAISPRAPHILSNTQCQIPSLQKGIPYLEKGHRKVRKTVWRYFLYKDRLHGSEL